jgi:hypothetical protein
VLACLACIQFLVTRACNYELTPLLRYAAHLGLQVYLPGVLALRWVNGGRPSSFTETLALGVPTGFAVEAAAFLGLSALGARGAAPFLPIVWLTWLGYSRVRKHIWPVRVRWSARHAGLALALSSLFVVTTLAAAAHMFAESPLVSGLPQRPIFHDWIYLISRAAAIRSQWPLEDPSLAGFPLQYHYFLLVHVASAAHGTGLEIGQVLLRLVPVALGGILVMQVFALGRVVSRRSWGGVVAAALVILAGETAYIAEANESYFLGRFVRWLFVSPTHYLGVIYFLALLLVLLGWNEGRRLCARRIAWLAILGAAATGAKGTVLPVLLPALALWAGWSWLRSRRFPTRLAVAGVVLFGAFAIVYQITMARWGTAAAAFVPYDIFGVSNSWRQTLPAWTAALSQWLPASVSGKIAALGCAVVILAGTLGVRLLAIPALVRRRAWSDARGVELLAFTALCAIGMGATMRLDGDGELYLFLLMRVPAAVLAAMFLVRGLEAWFAGNPWRTPPRIFVAAAVALIVAVTFAFQVRSTALGLRRGMGEWLRPVLGLRALPAMELLHEATGWLRHNAEPDAVIVANAFTQANREKDRWGALDGTLIGVHFYYSALSERRMLLEGPNYLLDPRRVIQRMEIAANIFYRQQPPTAEMFGGAPGYVLLDRAVGDAAKVALPEAARVFTNSRIDLYRVPRAADAAKTAAVAASHSP